MDGRLHRLPRGVEEDAAEGVLRGEGDRVDDAVDVAFEALGQSREVLFVRRIEFDDARGHGQALGDDLGDLHLPAEAREDDLGSLFLRDLRGGEGDRRLREHTGDEDALSLKNSHCGPFSVQYSANAIRRAAEEVGCQCPMPRPPSTGMTAPEM